jgi:ubiquinol-cytochrome c reductase cytochrome c1 subunit
MKRLIAVALGLFASTAFAAGSAIHFDVWPRDRAQDIPALQRGAALFANYCLGCHSANLMRWNRLRDIGLDEKQIKDFLISGNQKVGDTMAIAMAPKDAKAWFGKVPPDLSVIGRARTSFEYAGTDYLYTLLRGYYRDASSPTGWNNVAYPNIGMPHILWQRQGPREATITRVYHEDDGKGASKFVREVAVYDADGVAKVTKADLPGHPAESTEFSFKPLDSKAAADYDSDVADLVAYLAYMTEPVKSGRVRIGVWVLLFLGLFTVIAWRLNAVYWKDIR